jgi:Family of unknown function (DUF5681)
METKKLKTTGEKQNLIDARGTAERSIKNRYVKGVSGNPNGRPKGSRNFSVLVKDALQILNNKFTESEGTEKELPDWEAEIVRSLLHKSVKGDLNAISLFLKYTQSLPKQEIDFTGRMLNGSLDDSEKKRLDAMLSKLNK